MTLAFYWKGSCFGGLKPKNRRQRQKRFQVYCTLKLFLSSRYMYINIYIYISPLADCNLFICNVFIPRTQETLVLIAQKTFFWRVEATK